MNSNAYRNAAARLVKRARRRRLRGHRSSSVPPSVSWLLALGSIVLLALSWRRIAAPRSERERKAHDVASLNDADLPPEPASQSLPAPDTQLAEAGSGPLYHRRYEVVLADTALTTASLLRLMQRHLCELAPSGLAHFEKSLGDEDIARVDDEYDITMLGPWNGRVRVVDATADHFTMVTLDGHPEAGHITFSVTPTAGEIDAPLLVAIESWARARDPVVAAAYGTLGIGKRVQTEVWITFLQRLSALAGLEITPEVQIVTDVLSADPGEQSTATDV